MACAQPSIFPGELHKPKWDFNIETDNLISAWESRPYNNQRKKRTCKIVDFAVPADHRIRLKEH